jgi:hypothetical protein
MNRLQDAAAERVGAGTGDLAPHHLAEPAGGTGEMDDPELRSSPRGLSRLSDGIDQDLLVRPDQSFVPLALPVLLGVVEPLKPAILLLDRHVVCQAEGGRTRPR